MESKLRDPKKIMKLSKLGSFHQSKLSFLRSFLKEFKDWKYNRDLFDLDEGGFALQIKLMITKDQTELLQLNGMQHLFFMMEFQQRKI